MSFATRIRRRAGGCHGYLSLPGTAGNYASSPDSAAISITGDIDIRCKVALNAWVPTGDFAALVSKYIGAGTTSYMLGVNYTTGKLRFYISANGTATSNFISSVAPTVSNGAALWVRVTWQASDGRTQFFTSSDGTSWTQLGTNGTLNVGAIHDNASTLGVGAYGAGGASGVVQAAGKYYRVQILSGIDGTVVFDADFTNTGRSFHENANAAVVTVNGATAVASVYA